MVTAFTPGSGNLGLREKYSMKALFRRIPAHPGPVLLPTMDVACFSVNSRAATAQALKFDLPNERVYMCVHASCTNWQLCKLLKLERPAPHCVKRHGRGWDRGEREVRSDEYRAGKVVQQRQGFWFHSS